MADGWAYQNNKGDLSVATVSPTEITCMVNLLCMTTTRIPRDTDTDPMIREMTAELLRQIGGNIVPVTISLKVH